MAIIEVVSGGDRRSLMKRFERKSKQQAISELVDFHLLNCARIEKLEAERDAALARVAELELKLDTSDYAYDSDRSHIRGLAARAIARAKVFDDGSDGADAESARSVVAILRELLAVGPAPVAQAQHSVPEGLAEFSQFLSAVMDAAGLVRYGRRSKELSEYLGAQCMKYRLSAPVAQAQHSLPEGWMLVECGIWTQEQVDEMQKTVARFRNSEFVDNRALAIAVADAGQCKAPEISLAELLAAAPGKEVPQAWLDVQAERRRQVEVEGYHGFRDNHYISYELSKAARAYIEVSWHALSGGLPCKKPESWPWMAGFKWSDGRTMLVKACALALAEIERLDRAAHGKEGV
ncbi:hypothetical protein [Pseudomonas aeruginosa]|uniref:hypothetical protein n=2 Tax=Pseudomonas aeruginosa TaxID=287 RepID=UPI00159E902A|nr:hypothetical protein [Pseudomonas aeruginosa]